MPESTYFKVTFRHIISIPMMLIYFIGSLKPINCLSPTDISLIFFDSFDLLLLRRGISRDTEDLSRLRINGDSDTFQFPVIVGRIIRIVLFHFHLPILAPPGFHMPDGLGCACISFRIISDIHRGISKPHLQNFSYMSGFNLFAQGFLNL